jgi:hypothetical protein
MTQTYDVIIIGGGAAGFFAAITCAEENPKLSIVILEKGKDVLQKVKVSGGGRCNVTHACFEPRELVKNYPRGAKALMGPFSRFCTGDTMGWYDDRGVPLKIEEDGRVFPESDKSQSIIDCLVVSASNYNITILKHQNVHEVIPPEAGGKWSLKTKADQFLAKKVLVATGSSPRVWEMLKTLGHQIVSPVPSLFTFNIKDERIDGLAGISVPKAQVKIPKIKQQSDGPLLITHWGLSGPAVLKLSAWGARALHELNYQFDVIVNWLGYTDFETARATINAARNEMQRKMTGTQALFNLPQRLWRKMLFAAEIPEDRRWADVSKKAINKLANELTAGTYTVNGKSTFKEEFVTAGGISLKEIDFKRFESKLFPGLYFAGEVLDIDAVTGGFNFQAAWTGGWLAGKAMAE